MRVRNTVPLRQKQPRQRDEKHLAFIRTLPCVICNGAHGPSVPAHVRFTDDYFEQVFGKRHSGKQEKPDDKWVTPLCEWCHTKGPDAQHKKNEQEWWHGKGIYPLRLAQRLFDASSDEMAALEVLRRVRE